MASLYYRKSNTNYPLSTYTSDPGWESSFKLYISGVINYIPLSTNLSSIDMSDLRIRKSGLTYGFLKLNPFSLAVYGGGYTGTDHTTTIEYVNISNNSNTSNFGVLTLKKSFGASSSNGSSQRGFFAGGYASGFSTGTDVIDYITINTLGNAIDFGNCIAARRNNTGGTSNRTGNRGISAGDFIDQTQIEYITINSIGNAIDFGDLTNSRYGFGGCSNGSSNRGVFIGGANQTTIDYITINSVGNATTFGNISGSDIPNNNYATSNLTSNRGIFGSGTYVSYFNLIHYITINSIGNSIDFGDLTISAQSSAATSNGINNKGIFGGGLSSGPTYYNNIGYVTINSAGNAIDFGDLTQAKESCLALSSAI